MDDVVEFCQARLDEDQAAAKVAADEWGEDDPSYPWVRMLREVEAKRRILGMYEGAREDLTRLPLDRAHGATVIAAQATETILGQVVRQLAAVWSGHPGFREEWRP